MSKQICEAKASNRSFWLRTCGRGSLGKKSQTCFFERECADGLLQSQTVTCVASMSRVVSLFEVYVQCMSVSMQTMDANRKKTTSNFLFDATRNLACLGLEAKERNSCWLLLVCANAGKVPSWTVYC